VSFLSSLLAWANAPFTVALGVAVTFALLQMTGLLGLLAGGGDHEGDHDHDVDADADADADHDHDVDHDHDAEDHGVGHQLLGSLGVGRVPLSIIWQTYAVAFAFAGLAANAFYLGHYGAVPLVTLTWTVPSALVFGYAVTRLLSGALARVVADPKQEATTRKQLVGHSGVVISSKVSGEFGEVRLRDKTGHVVRIICRTREGEAEIPEGREVVIVDYDAQREHLFVAPLDDDSEALADKRLRAP
jgi:membrane protein implicated in regulation of membrane protease activity